MKMYLTPKLTEQELTDLAFEQARNHIGMDIKLQQDRKLFAFSFVQGYMFREDELESLRKEIQINNLNESIIRELNNKIAELETKICKCEVNKKIIDETPVIDSDETLTPKKTTKNKKASN